MLQSGSDVTDTIFSSHNDNKVNITWRSNDAHLWLWPIYRYIPSQFFLLRRCYGLQAILRHKYRIFISTLIQKFFYYFSRDICRKVFYSLAVLAHFMMRMGCSVGAIILHFFFLQKYHANVNWRLESISNAVWAHSVKLLFKIKISVRYSIIKRVQLLVFYVWLVSTVYSTHLISRD